MKPLRALSVLGALAATMAAALPASAQESSEFSLQYPAVITFENFAGVMYQRVKIEGAPDATEGTSAGTFTSLTPFAQPLPQIGFHYFVAPPLSLGLGVHYSDRDTLGSAFEVSPRVGVAIPFNPGTALWLRGGITYFAYDFGSSTYVSYSGISPGGEVLLVLEPVNHFGFMIGAKFDVSASAKRSIKGDSTPSTSMPDENFSYLQAGLTVGVLTDF